MAPRLCLSAQENSSEKRVSAQEIYFNYFRAPVFFTADIVYLNATGW